MNNKTLKTLTNKYEDDFFDLFQTSYSESLFLPSIDGLEFYIKQIGKYNHLEDTTKDSERYEEMMEINYLIEMAKNTLEYGRSISNSLNRKEQRKMIREFYQRLSDVLIFAEEMGD